MKKFCSKHRNLMGCLVAGVTFIALHLIVPALVAGTVAHQAHGASDEIHCLLADGVPALPADTTLTKVGEFDTDDLEKGKLSLVTFEAKSRRADPHTCVIGLLPGRFTTMYQMECL